MCTIKNITAKVWRKCDPYSREGMKNNDCCPLATIICGRAQKNCLCIVKLLTFLCLSQFIKIYVANMICGGLLSKCTDLY